MNRLAPGDRPREKLDRVGAAGLGDNELVAVVIGQGARNASALDVANLVLTEAGGVRGLTRVTRAQLGKVRGVGRARASQILAAVELGRRTLRRHEEHRPLLTTPGDAASFLMPEFSARRVEHFGVVLLDARSRMIKTMVLTVGGVDATHVHPRDVFREAALAGASSLIAFHNHPSGDPSPSADDVHLTRRLVDAGRILGTEVVDHLVLADARYFSFRESGMLERM